MKTRLYRAFSCVLMLSLGIAPLSAAAVVEIPDPNLRAAIELALNKRAGAAITVDDMATLTELTATNANISDLSGLEFATNLIELDLGGEMIAEDTFENSNWIWDLSPISDLTHLTGLYLEGNEIEDISALSRLTHLTELHLWGNWIEDISALSRLTHLTYLNLGVNEIEDISALSRLTHLTELHLQANWIEDISALWRLTNLTILSLRVNEIEDISALSRLTNLTDLWLEGNEIEDIEALVVNTGLGYEDYVALYSNPLSDTSIHTHIPSLRRRGVTVSVDDTSTLDATTTTVSVSPASVPSPAIGEPLTLALNITDGENVAGYQVSVFFDPTALEFVDSANGDFLPAGSFFVLPILYEDSVTLAASAINEVSDGDGTLAIITFEVVAVKPSEVFLVVDLVDPDGGLSYPEIENGEVIAPPQLTADVNYDGVVNIQDLVIVDENFGEIGDNVADVNGDGVVNIVDLVTVASAFGQIAAAPALHSQARAMLIDADVKGWLAQARGLDLTDATMQRGIIVLEHLLAVLTPKETALLPNYPNPFNPETWIPYHLAHAADVRLTIYNKTGAVVRRFNLGHQPAGYYTHRNKATYWDGRNESGEPVASGVYFYQLRAGNYSAVRRLVILK